MPHVGEITALLGACKQGDARAESRLMALIYADLHARAQLYMRRERRDHTLQPTALVHETYLRLMHEGGAGYESRAHFLAAASIVMRRILVDHARQRAAAKRPGGRQRVELNDVLAAQNPRLDQMLMLDEALTRLAVCDTRQARVVEMLFFGGLTRDPAYGKMTDPGTLHKYLYAAGDPVNRLDPTGRSNLVNYTLAVAGVVISANGLAQLGKCLMSVQAPTDDTLQRALAAASGKKGPSPPPPPPPGKDFATCLGTALVNIWKPFWMP